MGFDLSGFTLIADVLGSSGIAAVSVDIARILFVIVLLLFLVAAIAHAMSRKMPEARVTTEFLIQ